EEVVLPSVCAQSKGKRESLVLSLCIFFEAPSARPTRSLAAFRCRYAMLGPPVVLLLANPRATSEIPKKNKMDLIMSRLLQVHERKAIVTKMPIAVISAQTAASHCGCAEEAGSRGARRGTKRGTRRLYSA